MKKNEISRYRLWYEKGRWLSDENGSLAFPREILKNDSDLISNPLGNIINSLSIESIVVGNL